MTTPKHIPNDLLTPSRPRGWNQRADWLAAQQRRRSVNPRICQGSQAAALMAEMARAYCAGAYAAVIMLAQAVLSAEMAARSVATPRAEDASAHDDMGSATLGFGRDYVWLRQYRNRLAHGVDDQGVMNLALTVDDVGENNADMAVAARRAIELVFDAVLAAPSAGQ